EQVGSAVEGKFPSDLGGLIFLNHTNHTNRKHRFAGFVSSEAVLFSTIMIGFLSDSSHAERKGKSGF
ncbi:MAG: hypothetical protein UE819_05255, partial [Ruminococcus sp.]|nr:hypothetical protein [Ruminococcus sp.]